MMLSSSTHPLSLQIENGVLQRESSSLKKLHLKKHKLFGRWKCYAVMTKPQEYHHNFLSVSFTFFNHRPLYESPGRLSFDEYLEEKPRLVKATFPGKSQQLNQEEWRIETPKLELMFLKIWPTVDMKIMCKTNGEGYPFDVPHHITKVLEFEMTNWEINGIHKEMRPSSAKVCSRGAIYTEKTGSISHLKFQLQIKLSFLVPDALNFVPRDILQGIFKTVLKAMVEDLKHKTLHNLVEDYSEFRKEKRM